MNLENSLSLYGCAPAANRSDLLANLRQSLTQAFGRQMTAELREDELVLKIGRKTAWINSKGVLTGEASTPPSAR